MVSTAIDKACREIEAGLAPLKDLPPAERALKIREAFSGARQSIAFSLLKDVPVRDAVLRIMSGKIGSEEGRATLKAELGLPSWDIDIQALR